MRTAGIHGRILAVLGTLVLLACPRAAALPGFSISGQLSGWLSFNDVRPSTPRFGLRYIPSFSLAKPLGRGLTADGELSLNAYGIGQAPDWGRIHCQGRLKPYRAWVRLSSSQFEVRLGLQKINFGSASFLRPLMWFDRIDARDPLQITEGVYGLLVRYYFLKNANVWFWGLYGNEDPKGWETSPSKKRTPEFGGRLQVPISKGEIGFTFHRRRADLSRSLLPGPPLADPVLSENRYALDGKWDVGVGLSFEGTFIRQEAPSLPEPCQRALNVGIDTTFGIGNGLQVLAEHFRMENAKSLFGPGDGIEFSALSLSYPLGLLDNLSGIFFFDWKKSRTYSFLSWRRTYDQWQIYLIGFLNPERFDVYGDQVGSTSLAGKGLQIMVVLNH